MEDDVFAGTSQITLDIKSQVKQINEAIEKFAYQEIRDGKSCQTGC